MTIKTVKQIRLVFGVLFILSLLALLLLSIGRTYVSAPSPVPSDNTPVIVSMISFFTSFVTLIGLIVTTVIAWRKEQREAQTADVEAQLQQIELEKAKLELEKLKGEQGKSTSRS